MGLCYQETMTMFKGLPKDFFAFFKELAKNNERAWFEENKERYKASVVAPLSDFIAALLLRTKFFNPNDRAFGCG